MIGMVIVADEELKGLVPDASWDVQGVRDMVGGVVAVALVLAVGVIVIGCISMVPGLITNNMMERAFSWKRLAAALMVPFTIGAACTRLGVEREPVRQRWVEVEHLVFGRRTEGR